MRQDGRAGWQFLRFAEGDELVRKAFVAEAKARKQSKAGADDSRPKRSKLADNPSLTHLEDQAEYGVQSDMEMSEVDDPKRLTAVL